MKRRLYYFIMAMAMFLCSNVEVNGQSNNYVQARAILDKTAKIVGRAGGISASFSMNNPSAGTVVGTITVKGNKFYAHTPQTTVWFNGKTQWTYMKKNNEVNISTPTLAQQQMMNPYTFINIYKSGYYNMTATTAGINNEVHLAAKDSRRSIQEMYITINSKTNIPSKVKMKHNGKWYIINVSNFSTKNVSNNIFTFNSKDYPSAEVIDLR